MKFFLRVFFGFWIATILMIVMVANIGDLVPVNVRAERGFDPNAAQAALIRTVNDYEKNGRIVLDRELSRPGQNHHGSVFLFDAGANVLPGEGTAPAYFGALAEEVLRSGSPRIQRYFGFRVLFAWPLRSASGKQYAAIMTVFEPGQRLQRLRSWLNLTIAMLPAALICMLLSLYFTRPITRLRATAQRLAGGDLSARSSPNGVARRDELGDLARDFDAMAAQIESLMTAQRRFVADVSHELGGPLTRMHLALALLRRQLAGQGHAELERIERETDKLSNLVQQLLLLAGLEAGQCPAETLAPVSLRNLCDGLVEDAGFEAAQAGCRIGGEREDVTTLAYPQLLRRAIDNVLRNAIRYAPAGTEIVLNCRADPEGQVVLEILDSGPGVPDSMLSDIFRPFFRTAPGRDASSGGTGLGLAIAAETTRMHEGSITAHNRKNGGLQVTIIFPVKEPASSPHAPPSEESTAWQALPE